LNKIHAKKTSLPNIFRKFFSPKPTSQLSAYTNNIRKFESFFPSLPSCNFPPSSPSAMIGLRTDAAALCLAGEAACWRARKRLRSLISLPSLSLARARERRGGRGEPRAGRRARGDDIKAVPNFAVWVCGPHSEKFDLELLFTRARFLFCPELARRKFCVEVLSSSSSRRRRRRG